MSLIGLYFLFFKYGLLSFGGGYVLVPLMMTDLVNGMHLMTAEQFANLISIAQMTPGPIGINTATYTGYRLFGITGALAGTAGLLSPALLLVLLATVFIKRFEKTLWMSGALQGMRPAAFGLILVAMTVFANLSIFTEAVPEDFFVLLLSGKPAEWHPGVRFIPLVIAAVTVICQLKSKISFLWLILAGAAAGAVLIR